MKRALMVGLLGAAACCNIVLAGGEVTGQLKKWHRVTITFDGPESAETADPNPFLDYRLLVTFTCGDRRYVVPGFYAADGNAAESGATSGNKWRVHFTPDAVGQWHYRASFRAGKAIAVSLDPHAGKPVAFDGAGGTFRIAPSDKRPPDFRACGRLEYVGEHYLRFAESGRWFLKAGADSPENFLAYADFDGDRPSRKGPVKPRRSEAKPAPLHRYEPHIRHWRPGDPVWRGGKGKGIIGALNYLSSKGGNSVYFLTMNLEGDGRDVWPWTSETERYRFDCSKLDQWEVVFSHMDSRGIMLHVITQEQENDQLLDGGALGTARKLYYRELVARFAHHLAVVWNLGEENTNTDQQRKQFCRYIHALDPYDHPIVVHTFPNKHEEVYEPLLGFEYFEGTSLQTNDSHRRVSQWVRRSEQAGRKWVVTLDEIGPPHTGVKPDADDYWHDEIRTRHLWPVLMAGGAGVEWYFGYRYPHNDLNCEDWRSRDHLWDLTHYAVEFFQEHLPFWEMKQADELTDRADDYCFALPGAVYAVYLPRGGSTRLDLEDHSGKFTVRWYNPRTGGALLVGSVKSITGPGKRSLGTPPANPEKDWVVLVKAE